MMLAIIVLLTTIDVSVFAAEVREQGMEVEEKNKLVNIGVNEKNEPLFIADDNKANEVTVLENNIVETEVDAFKVQAEEKSKRTNQKLSLGSRIGKK